MEHEHRDAAGRPVLGVAQGAAIPQTQRLVLRTDIVEGTRRAPARLAQLLCSQRMYASLA